MRKKIIVLFGGILALTACEKMDEAQTQIYTHTLQVAENEKQYLEKDFTVDDVKLLVAKHGELTIEDFAPYIDLMSLEEQGEIWETLDFLYKGKEMCLRVSATGNGQNLSESILNGAVVFQKEFLELTSMEDEYAYQGSFADIRSGNLEHILDGEVEINDYMNVKIPKELIISDFKHWLGSCGGFVFLKKDELGEKITLENAGIYAEQQCAGGIEIWGQGEVEQHTETLEEIEPLRLGDVMLHREILRTDKDNVWYVAYTEKKDCNISYYLYLNEKEYTKEEFLKMSDTIQLMENAIY